MKSVGNKLKAIVKLCFAAAVLLALSTGFVRAVFFPKDVNEYESRMANQFPAFTAESFADSSFQDGAYRRSEQPGHAGRIYGVSGKIRH